MKNKMLLPLLAVVFAIAGAFASAPVSQMAWFKPISGPAQQGTIDDPSTGVTCTVSGSIQCLIDGRDAYDSQVNANSQNPAGLLKYD